MENLLDREGFGPRYALTASGAYVTADDGKRYFDLLSGFGSVVLGHGDPDVSNAVDAAVRNGVSPSLHSTMEMDLADEFFARVPGAEMSLFLKTGSDATNAAVRLARGVTGKKHVLRWGYQGWHDWSAPRPFGILDDLAPFVHELEFNDTDHLNQIWDLLGGQIAAVVIMPLETEPPTPTWLNAIRDRCSRDGAIFVLDEVRTGFRLARGGAQEHFGIRPDLVTSSKALANGHAISVLSGPRDLMMATGSMSVSSVFFRSTDGFAAALATLHAMDERGTVEHIWRIGELLQRGLRQIINSLGLPCTVTGLAPMPFHVFAPDAVSSPEESAIVFSRTALKAGSIFHPTHHWFINGAMTEQDISRALESATLGYEAVARHIQPSYRGTR